MLTLNFLNHIVFKSGSIGFINHPEDEPTNYYERYELVNTMQTDNSKVVESMASMGFTRIKLL